MHHIPANTFTFQFWFLDAGTLQMHLLKLCLWGKLLRDSQDLQVDKSIPLPHFRSWSEASDEFSEQKVVNGSTAFHIFNQAHRRHSSSAFRIFIFYSKFNISTLPCGISQFIRAENFNKYILKVWSVLQDSSSLEWTKSGRNRARSSITRGEINAAMSN